MLPMKVSEIAKLLNIAPNTPRKWASEFSEFLSPTGAGGNGVHRSFSSEDARIIAWIALLKAKNTTPDEIRLILRSAQKANWRDLPELPGGLEHGDPVMMMPVEVAETKMRSLQLQYEQQLTSISRERDDLRERLAALEKSEGSTRGENKALQQRIIELTAKEAELRGIASQYTFAGRRWNVAALIVAALVAGVLLTLAISLLVHR